MGCGEGRVGISVTVMRYFSRRCGDLFNETLERPDTTIEEESQIPESGRRSAGYEVAYLQGNAIQYWPE